MADSRRGKKQNYDKSAGSRREWEEKKREGRPKQKWVQTGTIEREGHWEKEN